MKTITTLALVLAASSSLLACSGDDDGADMGDTCTTKMYSKYGKDAFTAVNTKILQNIVQVSSLNPSPIGDSFKGLTAQAVARVEANLLDLLIKVYGGPDNYKGDDMETAHRGLNITSEQYDAFVGMVIVPALTASGVPNEDVTNCFAPPVVDAQFKASMVGK